MLTLRKKSSQIKETIKNSVCVKTFINSILYYTFTTINCRCLDSSLTVVTGY